MEIPGYKILKKIGEGGMSSVYMAVQESLQREVALKILNPVFTADPQFTERFLSEGRIVGKLNHPCIVPVHDIGVTDFHHFISMAYMEGGSLRYRMEAGIDEARAREIIAQLAEGLAHAHRHGLVHRDIKPENILFNDSGAPVLTDFGIAKVLREASRNTCTGITLGSPFYISPEQAKGQRIDGRSDIYSLGCVFFELLSGRPPYESDDSFAVLYSHVHDEVPRLPEDKAHWQPVIDRMMAKQVDQRYANAQALYQALQLGTADKRHSVSHSKPSTVFRSLKQRIHLPTLGRPRISNYKRPVVLASAAFIGAATGGYLITELIKKENLPPALQQSTRQVAPFFSYPSGFLRTAAEPVFDSDPVSSNEPKIDSGFLESDQLPGNDSSVATKLSTQQNSQQKTLRSLKEKVYREISKNRLTSPPGDNAWETYQRLYELSPGDPENVMIPRQIADRYLQLAIKSEPEDVNTARQYIERGLLIYAGHEGLLRMRDRLTPSPVKLAKQEAEPEKREPAEASPIEPRYISSGREDYLTAERYFYGVGVNKDIDKAVKWYEIAARKGYPEAQSSLGVCYANGTVVAKNDGKAVYWFKKAAEQGVPEAQYNLGLSYLNGKGNKKDLDEAHDWIREAAKQGFRKAYVALGWMYDNGIGVRQSSKKAVKWHAKAISKDISGSMPWAEKKRVKTVNDWEKMIKPYDAS